MAACPPELEILLSSYNGELHLPELLASLEAQSFKGFRLLARDDGSSDSSSTLLAAFAKTSSIECSVLPSSGNLGVIGSFNELVKTSSAPYAMFCDQDDVWLPEKVAKSLAAIQQLEAGLGPGRPALVHSDLAVVDGTLSPLKESLWKSQRLDALNRTSLPSQLVQNSVTACAMIVNRPLLEAACPIPAEAVMHDWHLAIAAAAFGGIKALPERLILYRQHGGNSLGFADFASPQGLVKTFQRKLGQPRLGLYAMFTQAEACLKSIRGLPPEAKDVIESFASIPKAGWLERRRLLLKGGFLKSGLIRNLGLLALI